MWLPWRRFLYLVLGNIVHFRLWVRVDCENNSIPVPSIATVRKSTLICNCVSQMAIYTFFATHCCSLPRCLLPHAHLSHAWSTPLCNLLMSSSSDLSMFWHNSEYNKYEKNSTWTHKQLINTRYKYGRLPITISSNLEFT